MNWFCNKPLTEEAPNLQGKTVTSSDESVEQDSEDTLMESESVTSSSTKVKKTQYSATFEWYVIKFPRHLYRNHESEIEVQKILSLPTVSKERKALLEKRPSEHTLFCIICYGFYSTKNLWRHRKTCNEYPNKGTSEKGCQSKAQDMLVRHLKLDPELKSKVFPRMRADPVSLKSKQDILICAFGSRYLRARKEKHFISLRSSTSNHLSKLFDALRPDNYDALVTATQAASKYTSDAQSYKSPTFALNIGTALKQCCEISLVHVLKKCEVLPSVDIATTEAGLRTLIKLIEGNWRFDVSTQVLNDLNIRKLNVVTLVPLAADLKLLK
nr:unnamed protein product [Callosobruchus analis]